MPGGVEVQEPGAADDHAGRGYRWTSVTAQAPFAPRDGAGALVFRDRMWLLGGWNPDDPVHFPRVCNSEVWSSADGLDWRPEVPQAPWEGRHTAGYAVHRDQLWIVGGDANQRHYQNDVWFSEDGKHWELACARVPWADRVLHYTVVHDGRIWVVGGQSMPGYVAGPDAFYSDVWCSEDGSRWERVLERAPWPARGMIGGSAVLGGRIWLLGGGTYDTPATPARRFYNDVWSSADGVTWEQHTEWAPWMPRQYHDVAAFDGRLWVLEGWNERNRNDVWHSSDGVHWQELPHTPWAPRHAAGVYVHRDALWMVAGNNMTPDVWMLRREDAPSGSVGLRTRHSQGQAWNAPCTVSDGGHGRLRCPGRDGDPAPEPGSACPQ
ncbi:MAG: Kelch repeat-containing protein [Anaerolineae bacterium]